MNRESLLELIKGKIIEVVSSLKDTDISIDQSLKDLGTNSIERMEIMVGILEELSLDMPRLELLNAQNISSLVELLERKLQINQ